MQKSRSSVMEIIDESLDTEETKKQALIRSYEKDQAENKKITFAELSGTHMYKSLQKEKPKTQLLIDYSMTLPNVSSARKIYRKFNTWCRSIHRFK